MAKLTKSQRASLSSSQYALSKVRKYPIPDKGHAQHAIRIGSIQVAKGNLTISQYNQIVRKVNSRFGFNAKLKPTTKAPAVKAKK